MGKGYWWVRVKGGKRGRVKGGGKRGKVNGGERGKS